MMALLKSVMSKEEGKKCAFFFSYPSLLSTALEQTKSKEKRQNLISFHAAALLLQIINTRQSQITAGTSELGTNVQGNEGLSL